MPLTDTPRPVPMITYPTGYCAYWIVLSPEAARMLFGYPESPRERWKRLDRRRRFDASVASGRIRIT